MSDSFDPLGCWFMICFYLTLTYKMHGLPIYTDYNSVGFLGQTTQFQSHVFLQLLCNVHRPKMNVLPKTISQCLKSKYIKQCDLKATNRGNAILSK